METKVNNKNTNFTNSTQAGSFQYLNKYAGEDNIKTFTPNNDYNSFINSDYKSFIDTKFICSKNGTTEKESIKKYNELATELLCKFNNCLPNMNEKITDLKYNGLLDQLDFLLKEIQFISKCDTIDFNNPDGFLKRFIKNAEDIINDLNKIKGIIYKDIINEIVDIQVLSSQFIIDESIIVNWTEGHVGNVLIFCSKYNNFMKEILNNTKSIKDVIDFIKGGVYEYTSSLEKRIDININNEFITYINNTKIFNMPKSDLTSFTEKLFEMHAFDIEKVFNNIRSTIGNGNTGNGPDINNISYSTTSSPSVNNPTVTNYPVNNPTLNNQHVNNQHVNNQPLNNQHVNNQPLNNQHVNNQPLNNQPVIPPTKDELLNFIFTAPNISKLNANYLHKMVYLITDVIRIYNLKAEVVVNTVKIREYVSKMDEQTISYIDADTKFILPIMIDKLFLEFIKELLLNNNVEVKFDYNNEKILYNMVCYYLDDTTTYNNTEIILKGQNINISNNIHIIIFYYQNIISSYKNIINIQLKYLDSKLLVLILLFTNKMFVYCKTQNIVKRIVDNLKLYASNVCEINETNSIITNKINDQIVKLIITDKITNNIELSDTPYHTPVQDKNKNLPLGLTRDTFTNLLN